MVKPELGMGATEICYSDRHAYTIIEVISERKIVVQQDKAVRTDDRGMSEMQDYDYSTDEDGRTYDLRLNKHEQWVAKDNPNVFVIGYRREYYDFSF